MPCCFWSEKKSYEIHKHHGSPSKLYKPPPLPTTTPPPIPTTQPPGSGEVPPPEKDKTPPITPPETPPETKKEDLTRRQGILPSFFNEITSFEKHAKTASETEVIKKALAQNEYLNQVIAGKKLEDVVDAMYRLDIEPGQLIIKKGDFGDKMYILDKGKLEFKGDGFRFEETTQKVFGELAILYKAKRLADVKALTKVSVWILEGAVYEFIKGTNAKEEHTERMRFLRQVKTLNDIDEDLLQAGADVLETEFFQSGSNIVTQGDKGDKFYIIRAGTVTIHVNNEGKVGELQKGQSFGELALKGEDRRQATVIANPPGVECLTLTRDHFDMYFKNVKVVKLEPAEIDDQLKQLSLYDLKITKTLGIGAFGRVELVVNTKHPKEVYALKYIKKHYIVEQNLQEHIFNEKILQMACKSLFIVRSYKTFKDNKYVYFMMEACLGGDLFALLHKQKQKRFDEADSKFISGCVLEGLDYLHKRDIIFRDLKPENLMIDGNGYVKITDFGYAKKLVRRKTFTFAGTPEYVAPEILQQNGHDRGVDYWAFGILVFELLTGKTPFKSPSGDDMKTYNKIQSGVFTFPQLINNKARTLIEKLLKPISKDRLGMQRNGADDIRKQVWYQGFNWDQLQKGQMKSNFKPKLSGPADTRHIENFKRDDQIPPDELSGWDEKF